MSAFLLFGLALHAWTSVLALALKGAAALVVTLAAPVASWIWWAVVLWDTTATWNRFSMMVALWGLSAALVGVAGRWRARQDASGLDVRASPVLLRSTLFFLLIRQAFLSSRPIGQPAGSDVHSPEPVDARDHEPAGRPWLHLFERPPLQGKTQVTTTLLQVKQHRLLIAWF